MIISNSQVATKNLCDRAHYYRYIRNKEPKKLSPVLYRGVMGHLALQDYYLEHKEGSQIEVCRDAALSVLDKEIARIAREEPQEFELVAINMQLRKLLEDYAEVYRVEPFKVLEVEKDFTTPVGPDIDYILQLDVLIEMIKGEYRGDLVVMDHKFVYNFKSALDIQMDAQLPKYVKTLQDNGYTITKGIFNQIRTRQIKNPSPEDIYRRDLLKTNKKETETIWREQEEVAAQILYDRFNTERPPIRTMNYLVCRFCAYQGPCKAELNGDDATQMLEANFQEVVSPLRLRDLSDVS